MPFPNELLLAVHAADRAATYRRSVLLLLVLLFIAAPWPVLATESGDEVRIAPADVVGEQVIAGGDVSETDSPPLAAPDRAPGRDKPGAAEDPTGTVYRVVVDIRNGAALHRARESGLDAVSVGATTYEIDRQLLRRLQQAGLRTWIVGGTSRFSLDPDLVPPPGQWIAEPDPQTGSEGDTGADYGGTIDLTSGTIDLTIADNDGTAQAYRLRREEAPAGAQVTTVYYRTRVSDEGDGAFYCGDYELWLFSGDAAFELSIYDNLGARTDGGFDDDSADDEDIYLNWRSTGFFSGEDPNQWWGIVAWDNLSGDDGHLDYIQFEIDWVVEGGDAYEPDNSTTEAYDMPQNYTSAFRSIEPVGDEDWFRFSLNSASSVTLETMGPSGDTRLWLYDSALNQIDFDDDGGDDFFSLISCSLGSGTYYGQVDEYNDDQVIRDYALSLSVEAAEPDLVAALFRHPSEVTEGDTTAVEVDVRNDGAATAGSSHARLYLSIDGDFDVDDDYVVTPDPSVASLSSGATDTVTWSFTFPALLDAPSYVVWLLTDVDSQDEVGESNESNVYKSAGYIIVTAPDAPNLIASDVALRTETGGGGSPVSSPQIGQQLYPHIYFTIQGPDPVSGVKVWNLAVDGGVLCSSTATLDPGSYVGWCPSPWTATAGSHLLRGEVDPDGSLAESNENDNAAEDAFSTTSGPEIRIEPLSLRFEEPAGDAADAAAAKPGPSESSEERERPQPLFLEVGASDVGASFSPAAAETRRVVVNRGALLSGARRLTAPLFDESEIRLQRTDVVSRGRDRLTWRGRVEGTGERVVLSVVGPAVSGLLYTPDGVYELGQQRDGAALARLDPGRYPPCGEPLPPLPGSSRRALSASAGDDPPDQIDVLALYTPQARDEAGGTAAIESTIQAAVDMANTAFIDSDMVARFRLVHTALANYDDSGSSSTDLNWVSTDPDVASLRDQVAADMVGLIVADGGGFCGRGYVMRNPGPSFADFAFQVTARGCAVGNLTYAHEHGHNMGFEHDPANGTSPSSASYPYAFGHFVSGSYRTVMSYSSECTAFCPREPHFSNPAVLEQGAPTGIADERDNHRAGDLTAPVVANFRQAAVPSDSFAIYNDGSAVLSVTSIEPSQNASWLSWSPQAPLDIQPGSSVTVQVSADLNAAPSGETTRRLLVESNDSDRSPYPGGVDVTTVTTGTCSPLSLTNRSVTGYEIHEACSTVTADTGVVVQSGGELVLRSGSNVVLGNGFEVRSGGKLRVEVDPALGQP